jgi:hypothetical protein
MEPIRSCAAFSVFPGMGDHSAPENAGTGFPVTLATAATEIGGRQQPELAWPN